MLSSGHAPTLTVVHEMTSRVPALLIHGGAGADPEFAREELRQGIRDAVAAGWARLREGGSAVDAVEAAVAAMEDNPRFNAGRGSVLTSDGTVEMDASIMEGDTLRNGAVACVTNIATRSRWPGASSRPTAIPSS